MKKFAWRKCRKISLRTRSGQLTRIWHFIYWLADEDQLITLRTQSGSFKNIECHNPEYRCVICHGVTLFALVLHLNCTALSQSESSNFFMYIINKGISLYTLVNELYANFSAHRSIIYCGFAYQRQNQGVYKPFLTCTQVSSRLIGSPSVLPNKTSSSKPLSRNWPSCLRWHVVEDRVLWTSDLTCHAHLKKFVPVIRMKCSYGKIFIPIAEISVIETEISVIGLARLLIWTHQNFYKGNRNEARSQ